MVGLSCGAAPYITGHPAAFLASTHRWPGAPCPHSESKNISRHCHGSLVENHCEKERCVRGSLPGQPLVGWMIPQEKGLQVSRNAPVAHLGLSDLTSHYSCPQPPPILSSNHAAPRCSPRTLVTSLVGGSLHGPGLPSAQSSASQGVLFDNILLS